ncbi:calcium/sodium antiporter [Thermotoga neapolitana]|uniref:Na+/Ca+ antiporter, CaCA family n=1 Tax=Thermotoga neapolitana (strain ATCC 49049 / DSM 4359 / NBRC 107923 / NS-E) TaxID=309803 RepID=B9KAQ3_THENN|nr:calcium/sodium antiporter [Thermotoga neapolitana]ACM24036.1 Na+/Ca+ antiporter, CaCA family precursor [Thermotoga neapolitana DSM 4359]KFZ20828.1 Na+/Ca+ antiporter, CaCA family precursor [Thermotoga neapolitana LA10]HBF10918.1 sodium:calcium antiporter [Thermotoga neapolitana]
MEFLLTGLGITILVLGANWLIEGASSLALRLGISKLVVGLSVVAFGTSLPELVSSIVSASKGYTSIAISNVVGSNIANVGLCLGLAALFRAIPVKKSTIRSEIPFMILSTLSFISLFLKNNYLSWNDGVVFLSFMAIFMYYLVTSARDVVEEEMEEIKEQKSVPLSVAMISGGILALWFGGNLAIENAVKIARNFGLSQAFVGLTIVAVGTSLPELVVSVVSTVKKESDILVGNIVGSNIFNILLILGVSSFFNRLTVDVSNYTMDLVFLLVTSILVFVFSVSRKRISRLEGVSLLLVYSFYIYLVVSRG